MEITAAIIALESLAAPTEVILYTDSRYLADAVNLGWAKRWKANQWKRNGRKSIECGPVENFALCESILLLLNG